MARHGKRFTDASKLFKRSSFYPLDQAVALTKQMANAKFDETIEIAMNLGIDPRHADQNVRGVVLLPHGTGKRLRVAVFAKGDKAKQATAAGADLVGAEDLAEKVQGGTIEFDRCIATPDMMGVVGRLGKVLGPRGLMPNPKTGTVTPNVAQAIKEIKAGKVEFRVDKTGIIHAPVGKTSFATDKLVANTLALVDSVVRAKPAAAKGKYLKSVTVSSTMGPGVRIDTAHIDERTARH